MNRLINSFMDIFSSITLSPEALVLWLSQIGVAVAIFLSITLLRKFFTHHILSFLIKLTNKTKNELDNYLVVAFEGPLKLFFIALGVYLALAYLPLNIEANLWVAMLFRSVLIILVLLGLWNLVGNYEVFAKEMAEIAHIKIDKLLIPFLSKALKFILALLALSVLLQEWEYDITGFIAGLGLGGLAFALAAQETVANLFGGIVLITDKPFSIGDWIVTPSVDGTVEDINFRSTKVRTFAQAVVTVPNSKLANEPITNWSRMGKRQITFKLRVAFHTPQEIMEKLISDLKDMLIRHPDIHPETIMVSFDSFGDSGLNILLYFFSKKTNWERFLKVKEDVNLKILNILESNEVSLALPSTSVYFENEIKGLSLKE